MAVVRTATALVPIKLYNFYSIDYVLYIFIERITKFQISSFHTSVPVDEKRNYTKNIIFPFLGECNKEYGD